MDQTVEIPTAQDMDKISKLLLLSNILANEVTGKQYCGTLDDLDIIQSICDSPMVNAETTLELQSLGITLGQVLANTDRDYDWWVVEDDDGRDPCLRFRESNLLVFPQTFLSKRIEEGQGVDVVSLYWNLVHQLGDATRQLSAPTGLN